MSLRRRGRIHFASDDIGHLRSPGDARQLPIYEVADARPRTDGRAAAGERDGIPRWLASALGSHAWLRVQMRGRRETYRPD